MNYKPDLKEELKMYFLTMYNISDKQKGIQSLHAVIRYVQNYKNDEDFNLWADKYETVIILDGGTSTYINYNTVTNDDKYLGSMEKHELWLKTNKIKYAKFNEQDLNYATSGLCFLMDARVFDRNKYPEYNFDNIHDDNHSEIYKLRSWIFSFKLA